MLQRPNSNVCNYSKKSSEGCPSNQVSVAAMTSASDDKRRPSNCFFQSSRAKDLPAPLYTRSRGESLGLFAQLFSMQVIEGLSPGFTSGTTTIFVISREEKGTKNTSRVNRS